MGHHDDDRKLTDRAPQDQAAGSAAAEDQETVDAMLEASNGEAAEALSDEPARDPAPRAAGKAAPDVD